MIARAIFAPAQEFDHLFPVQMAHACFREIDFQLLHWIGIHHWERDFIIYAADRIHNLGNALEIHNHIFVRREAHDLLDLLFGLFDALLGAIGRVNLAVCARLVDVGHGIARHVHDVHRMLFGIERHNHNVVGTGFVDVGCTDNKGKEIINTVAHVEIHADRIAVFRIVDCRVIAVLGGRKAGRLGDNGDIHAARNHNPKDCK